MNQKHLSVLTVITLLSLNAQTAAAFCGFYVAKADASLFNNASQVVLARHDNKTVVTMSNDYQGELTEFAMVVPVPEGSHKRPDSYRQPKRHRPSRCLYRTSTCRIF